MFAARISSVLSGDAVPGSDSVAKAVAGGQARSVLHAAPAAVRDRLDGALRAASVSGVQWTFLVSGIAGVLTGLAVLAMIRPRSGIAETQRESDAEPVAA